MTPTLNDFVARFAHFDPTMAGWLQTAAKVPEDLFSEIEARVFDRVAAPARRAPLTWAQVKKPKPWMRAWVRTLVPDGAKLDPKRCAELGESPLLDRLERLELIGTKKVDGEALAALFAGSRFQVAALKHFGLRPDPKKTSAQLGRVVAEHLGATIESLDVDGSVLEGMLDAKLDFPALRHLSVRAGRDADRLAPRLVAWPPFARLCSLTTEADGALVEALERHPVVPPVQRLEVEGPLAIALLPHAGALEHLKCRRSEGVLDALSEHPQIQLRSLEVASVHSDEMADYFRSSNADRLETLRITGYDLVTRRSCCEAMAASNARPIDVELCKVSPEGAVRLLEAGFFERTERLTLESLAPSVVDALLEHRPPQLEAIAAAVDASDQTRLEAAFGDRARVRPPYTAPEALASTLRFALQQLDKVNGSADADGVETLGQLWWEEDNLAHDAFHCGVSGVSWRAIRALDGLERASRLRTLVVPCSDIDALDPVAGSPLETVNVANNRRLRSLAPLVGCSTLCELDISHTAVRDLSPLASISTLRKLKAVGLEFGQDQLPVLAALRRQGTEVLIDTELSRAVDALAYPAGDDASSEGAALLRRAELPALADEWDSNGPNSRDGEGRPIALRVLALLRRDQERRREIVCGLIDAGADIDAESFGVADTLLAASVHDSELCNRLLDLGADPNLPAACPAIERLIGHGERRDRALIDRLVEAGAAMTPRALTEAARLGDLALVRYALAAGLDVHTGDMGRPIEQAASGGSAEVVGALLAAGADPSQGLPYARSLEVYDLLVASGASPTARSGTGDTILEQIASASPDNPGSEDVIAAAVRDGVRVTGDVLSKAVERCRDGGLPFFQALADAGAALDVPWYAWNQKKNVHQPRTLRDQRLHPKLVAFAKEQNIPTGASRLKQMLKPLAKHSGPLAPGEALWREVLAVADLLPGPDAHQPPRDVLPAWIGPEADRARGDLPAPLCSALAGLPPTHPAVLLALAEGPAGLTPSDKGMLSLACQVERGDASGLGAVLEGLIDAGAPVDVGCPLPLQTYLQAAATHGAEVSAGLVERLMHPRARTRSALYWMAVAVNKQVDDRERVLAAFDEPQDARCAVRDVAVKTYAEIGDLGRTIRAAEGQHWITLTHALNQALQADHLGVVEALLERGAAPNFHALGTNPALFWARSGGAVRRLCSAGARLEGGGRQRPAGSIISFIGHAPHLLEVLDALVEAGASLSDVEPSNGQTLQAQLRALGREDVNAWLDARS